MNPIDVFNRENTTFLFAFLIITAKFVLLECACLDRIFDQTNIPTCVREKKLCKFHCRAKAACDNKAVSTHRQIQSLLQLRSNDLPKLTQKLTNSDAFLTRRNNTNSLWKSF